MLELLARIRHFYTVNSFKNDSKGTLKVELERKAKIPGKSGFYYCEIIV